MTIGPAIFARLTTDPGVSALIGDRIYPQYDREADRTYPLAVYKVENETDQLASSGPTGLVSADYVIAAIAPTARQANQAADAIKAALNGRTWTDTANALNVQGCFLADDGRRDDVVTNPDSEAIVFYVAELTFNVFCNSTN